MLLKYANEDVGRVAVISCLLTPIKYENEFYNYISMKKDEFIELTDKFRPDHLWKKKSNRWELKKPID